MRDPIDPARLATLTAREREILRLMAGGHSNGEICRALWLSPKTVETHCRSIFSKLGLCDGGNRRVRAVLLYLRAAEPPAVPIAA